MTSFRRYRRAATLFGVWLLLSPAHVVAQQTESGAGRIEERQLTPAGVPLVHALRVDNGPLVDGDVLNDPVYTDARSATGFVQSRPFEGEPASERTEVRIVYTGDTLYFGVVCYTEDPSSIIVANSRRDTDMTETDSFRIILDTYRDGQNGFVFGTNPIGVEYDGQVTNEGQGSGRFSGRQQRGSGGGFNLNWDGAWQVVTRATDVGWTAEIAIPFRTLRYPRTEVQTWGVNFQRNIRISNEQTYWSPLPRQYDLNRLSLAGELRSLRVPPQRNLQVTPYALGEALHRAESGRNLSTGDVGADLKYSVTPSMTLDLTYNTDFAQVEVDDEQVNLDRFTLFFPEKRAVLSRERRAVFCGPAGGRRPLSSAAGIGLGDDGEQIPIIGGGRLSGKIGTNTNIGFLNMQTQSIDATGTPMQNFTVGRVRQDLANRSNVGAVFVNRQASGGLGGRPRLQPDVCVRRALGDRARWYRLGLCGRDRYTRRAGGRGTRLRARRSTRFRARPSQPRVHRGRTELQSGGRIPGAPELPADERTCLHDVPSRQLHGCA